MARARKTTAKRTGTSPKKRRSTVSRRQTDARIGKTVIGIVLGAALVAGIAVIGVMGYRSAISSRFFDMKSVVVSGVERSSEEDIRRIVTTNVEKTGIVRADIAAIREKIEKLPFVKSAAVSMRLPAGVSVNVTERVPVAIVRLQGGDQLVDNEGVLLAPAAKTEVQIPFAMRGWDESKTANAQPDNLARLKLYKKMIEDWREFGLADRVKEVNLADLREPAAVIEESGRPIGVFLAKDNLAKGLKAALEAVAGKGEKVRSVNAGGVYPVLEYLTY